MLKEIVLLLTPITGHDRNKSESLVERKSSFSYATTIVHHEKLALSASKKVKVLCLKSRE